MRGASRYAGGVSFCMSDTTNGIPLSFEAKEAEVVMTNINILDPEYLQWVQALSKRYRQSQVRAAVRVNEEMLRFYWELGRDIVALHVEERWGTKAMQRLSADLRRLMPDVTGLSQRNIYYCKQFFLLYSSMVDFLPQLGAKLEDVPQTELALERPEAILPQLGAKLGEGIFGIPWGHIKLLIDKCFDNPEKAYFYVQQTQENGWSRAMLHNAIAANLYERQGKALTNFSRTLPAASRDLAKELTKDPYDFAFTGITQPYNERMLKEALLQNITHFLTELGTGFAYLGREYRLEIGDTENFIDLLFYNLKLSCYVVIEVKIGKFEFSDVGQLGGYVVACNHLLRKEGRDNPTIGLLICKEKDRIQAQYALESSSQPIGISEYELERFYPEKVDGTIPTIEELEKKLLEETEEIQ